MPYSLIELIGVDQDGNRLGRDCLVELAVQAKWGFYKRHYLGTREDLYQSVKCSVIKWCKKNSIGDDLYDEHEVGIVIKSEMAREVGLHPKSSVTNFGDNQSHGSINPPTGTSEDIHIALAKIAELGVKTEEGIKLKMNNLMMEIFTFKVLRDFTSQEIADELHVELVFVTRRIKKLRERFETLFGELARPVIDKL